MRRRLCIVILLGLLLGALFVAPAEAVTYHGGTPAQQAYAQGVIEECWEPWQAVEQKLPGGVWPPRAVDDHRQLTTKAPPRV